MAKHWRLKPGNSRLTYETMNQIKLLLTSDKPIYVNFGSAPLLAETALATGAPPTGGILPVWGRNGGEDSVWKGRPQAMSGV